MLRPLFERGGLVAPKPAAPASAAGGSGCSSCGGGGGGSPVVRVSDSTESPALRGSPYHPDAVEARRRPPYEPVHSRPGYVANPHKTPEPPDAERAYRSSVRGERGTFYAVGERGIYRYFTDGVGNRGNSGVTAHFSGIVPPSQVPTGARGPLMGQAWRSAMRRGVGPRGAE